MLTAYFSLNESDIQRLKLNDKIRINNSWWNINKVIDYNANNRQLTKVELLSIDEEALLTRVALTSDTTTDPNTDDYGTVPTKPNRPIRPTKPNVIGSLDGIKKDYNHQVNTALHFQVLKKTITTK
jgi:hypothetical protein